MGSYLENSTSLVMVSKESITVRPALVVKFKERLETLINPGGIYIRRSIIHHDTLFVTKHLPNVNNGADNDSFEADLRVLGERQARRANERSLTLIVP